MPPPGSRCAMLWLSLLQTWFVMLSTAWTLECAIV
jgi:hypothetical protein